MNLFEQASRHKFKYKAANGVVNTEDLWGLSLEALNTIGMGLRKELRDSEDSLIGDKKADVTLEQRFQIVKHIIDVKLAEKAARADDRAKAVERQKLLEALEADKDEEIRKLSRDEKLKRLAALD